MKLTINEWKLIIEALEKWERDTAYAIGAKEGAGKYIAMTNEKVHDLKVKIENHGF